MSTSGFIGALKSTGYDKKINPSALQWMFHLESRRVKALLRWMCQNLSEDNVVTASEREDFGKIPEGKVLDDSELEEAFGLIESEAQDSIDSLGQDLKRLDSEIADEKSRLDSLVSQRTALSNHHVRRVSFKEAMKKERIAADTSLRQAETALQGSCGKLDQALNTLSSVCEVEIAGISEKLGESKALERKYIFQTELKAYQAAEEDFTRALNKYWEKQFHPQLEKGVREEERPGVFALDDAMDYTLTPGEKKEFGAVCFEMRRLQQAYQASMDEWVTAGELLSKEYALEAEVTDESLLAESGRLERSLQTGQDTLKHLQGEKVQLEEERRKLRAHISKLVQEVRELQIQPVLLGNFKLKLARYQYYGEKLDYLTRAILSQIGRKRMLMKGLKVESKTLKELKSRLLGISNSLMVDVEAIKARTKTYKSIKGRLEMSQRNTVDDRDALMGAVRKLLETVDGEANELQEQHGFVSYKMLEATATRLCSQRIENEIEDLEQSHRDAVANRKERVDQVMQIMVGSRKDEGKDMEWPKEHEISRINLTTFQPKEYAETMQKHSRLQRKLHYDVALIQKEFKDMCATLSSNKSNSKIRRSLFVNFFTKREKLKEDYQKLKDRIAAQKI